MIGGAVHIPIVIGLLKFCDNKTSQSYKTQKAAEEQAKNQAESPDSEVDDDNVVDVDYEEVEDEK